MAARSHHFPVPAVVDPARDAMVRTLALPCSAVPLGSRLHPGGVPLAPGGVSPGGRALQADDDGLLGRHHGQGQLVSQIIDPAAATPLLCRHNCMREASRPSRRTPDAAAQAGEERVRLLASELSGPLIARELMVSLSTMRTHTKNIYMKLGVSTRRAAVRRAQQLSLLPGPH
jgi:DNA-binding CsgD family transcriptional regulator